MLKDPETVGLVAAFWTFVIVFGLKALGRKSC